MVTIMKDYVSWRAQALISKKPIKRGDVLLTSKPFCSLLDSSNIGSYCEHCLSSPRKERVLTRCSGCRRAWYCSQICWELGQPLHRRECIVFKTKPEYQPKDFARFIARLIWRLREGGAEVVEKIDAKRSRRFRDLMSHVREIRRDPDQMKYLNSLMPDLNILVGSRFMPPRDFLITIYGKVLVNSFCLLDDRLTPIGMSLYLAASIIDHACTANAFVSFLGNKLVVRSLVNWPDLDWDMVHISYIDVMNSRKERQELLRRQYYFTCDCRLCRDDEQDLLTSTVACGFPSCSRPIYIDESADGGIDPCVECGYNDHHDNLRQDYRTIAKLTRHKMINLDEQDPDLEVWRDMVKAQDDLLHPLNVLKAKSLDALLTATLNMSGWHSAWGLARRNHDAIRHYYGAKHPTYGLFLMKLGKIELNNMASALALEHLKEAEEILEAGLGSNHPLVYLELAWLMIQASEETRVEIQRSLIYGDRRTPPYIHALAAHDIKTKNKIQNGDSVHISKYTEVNANNLTSDDRVHLSRDNQNADNVQNVENVHVSKHDRNATNAHSKNTINADNTSLSKSTLCSDNAQLSKYTRNVENAYQIAENVHQNAGNAHFSIHTDVDACTLSSTLDNHTLEPSENTTAKTNTYTRNSHCISTDKNTTGNAKKYTLKSDKDTTTTDTTLATDNTSTNTKKCTRKSDNNTTTTDTTLVTDNTKKYTRKSDINTTTTDATLVTDNTTTKYKRYTRKSAQPSTSNIHTPDTTPKTKSTSTPAPIDSTSTSSNAVSTFSTTQSTLSSTSTSSTTISTLFLIPSPTLSTTISTLSSTPTSPSTSAFTLSPTPSSIISIQSSTPSITISTQSSTSSTTNSTFFSSPSTSILAPSITVSSRSSTPSTSISAPSFTVSSRSSTPSTSISAPSLTVSSRSSTSISAPSFTVSSRSSTPSTSISAPSLTVSSRSSTPSTSPHILRFNRSSTVSRTRNPARFSTNIRSNVSTLIRPVHAHIHVYAHVPAPARARAIIQGQEHLHVPVLAQANVREHRHRNHVQESVRSLPHTSVHALSRGRC